MSLTYTHYINKAFDESLRDDPRVLLFGLGVGDVGAVFGSTANLQSKYGSDRVFEIPISENAVTGMALGLAMQGFRPVLMHQRADFSFTSAEQIINQIATVISHSRLPHCISKSLPLPAASIFPLELYR